MRLSKSLNSYLKDREKNVTLDITEIRNALNRSGYKDYIVFYTDTGKLVLLDISKDVTPGVITKGGTVKDFANTKDFQAVTIGAYARLNILNSISNDEDLQAIKDIFKKKRTWVIHQYNKEDGSFEARTRGMANYSHMDFIIHRNIGEEDVSYLLNSLCRSVQLGNSLKNGDRIENLYENCDIILRKTPDDLLEIIIAGT